jgi:hypothetical protein
MKVTRGKSFETQPTSDGGFWKRGKVLSVWEKIEVELDDADLLPEEKAIEAHLQPLLLEIRAEQQLIMFLRRVGHITKEEAEEQSAQLKAARRSVLSMSKTNVPPRLKVP